MSLFVERLLRSVKADNAPSARSVKWIDGLRGLASFSVIVTHLSRGFDYALFKPSDGEGLAPRLAQWPFVRIIFQGRIGVAIFALLTGFVCGLKPLKQARAGDPHAALTTLARSAFGRVPRLMLPAAFATLIAVTLLQLGAFKVAKRCDADWIQWSSPVPEPTLRLEFWRLTRAFRSVWTDGNNPYDDHQWALLALLKCSLEVYLVLVAVVFLKFKARVAVYLIMVAYFWQDHRPDTETFGAQSFYGVFLCDLSQHPPFQAFLAAKSSWFRRFASATLIVSGLYFASYPQDERQWVRWSSDLSHLEPYLFPVETNVPKRFTALGVLCLSTGLVMNNSAKTFLSSRPLLWLGRYSFAVYLVHGTLLRTVFIWMIYGPSGEPWVVTKDGEGKSGDPPWLTRCGKLGFVFAIPLWLSLVYTVAHMWTTYVDAYCAIAVRWLQDVTKEPDEKHANGNLMA